MTVVPLTAGGVFAIAAIAFAGAIAQSLTGLGFSLVCGPVFFLVLGAANGVRVLNTIAVAMNVVLLVAHRRDLLARQALLLALPAVVVTPLAAAVVHRSDPDALLVAAGGLVIGTALLLWHGVRLPGLDGAAGVVIAGSASAAMNAMAGIGGPTAAVYGLNAGWTPAALRATLQLYFLVLNLITIVALGPVRVEPEAYGAIAAALVAGIVVGRRVDRSLPQARVRHLVLGVAMAGGTAVLARAAL